MLFDATGEELSTFNVLAEFWYVPEFAAIVNCQDAPEYDHSAVQGP